MAGVPEAERAVADVPEAERAVADVPAAERAVTTKRAVAPAAVVQADATDRRAKLLATILQLLWGFSKTTNQRRTLICHADTRAVITEDQLRNARDTRCNRRRARFARVDCFPAVGLRVDDFLLPRLQKHSANLLLESSILSSSPRDSPMALFGEESVLEFTCETSGLLQAHLAAGQRL